MRSPPASATAASSPGRSRSRWGSARRTCRWPTAQVLLYIGASCFPMPGASGASEGTFYLAFSPLFGDYLTTAMLIWRLASYYLTIVLGYIAVVAERVTLRRAET